MAELTSSVFNFLFFDFRFGFATLMLLLFPIANPDELWITTGGSNGGDGTRMRHVLASVLSCPYFEDG